MILMLRNGVKIGTLFMLPMFAMSIAVLIYALRFGYTELITWLMDKPREPQAQAQPNAFG